MELTRRKLIKGMTAVPLVVSTRPSPPRPQSQAPSTQSAVSDRIAVNVVRLFNTLELNYKLKHGKFGTRDQLFAATSAAWFVNNRAAKKHNLDDAFFRALHLGDDEVVSGWKLSMIKSEDELAYSLSLVRTE